MTGSKAFGFPVIQWLLAMLMGVTLGYVLAARTTLILEGVLVIVLAWVAFYYPPFTVIMFWVAYALQTTVFAGKWLVQGLYYPVYALMTTNVFIYIITLKRQVYMPPRLILWVYAGFYGVVLMGLAWQPSDLSVNTMQRLLIYAMGILTALQIRTEEHKTTILWTMITTGLFVAVWTVVEAHATGFAYRGGADVNPNYIATIIDLGLVTLFAGLVQGGKKYNLFASGILWGVLAVGLYTNLLLASRGVVAALLTASGIVLIRNLRVPSKVISVSLLLALIGIFLLDLPGSQNLAVRLLAGDDSYNGRLQLWEAGQKNITSSPFWGLLFGNGMGASEIVVRGVHPQLTSMHNVYVQATIEYGVVGLMLFVLLLAGSLWQIMRVRGHLGDASVGILVFLMVVSLTATATDTFIFWIALGVALPKTVPAREAR